jgi:hypothetical protein
MDTERVYEEWMERKVTILNSRILENFLKLFEGKFQRRYKKLDDGFKLAEGTVKMKLFKTLVEKMGSVETPVYYIGEMVVTLICYQAEISLEITMMI